MKLYKIVENLIKNNKIRTQSELTELLSKEGIKTTQPNLSRIVKKINAVKNNDESGSYYVIPTKPLEVERWVRNLITSIDDNGYLIVIKTYSGAANILAEIIDQQSYQNILGSIAGDNTIMITPKNTEKTKELRQELEDLFLFKK